VPKERADVLIVRGPTMEIDRDFVTEIMFASVTCTVKLESPVAVGVPDISPVGPSRTRPSGRAPETTDHAYGVLPPVAANDWLYAAPIVPAGKDAVVMIRGLYIEIENIFVVVREFASLTCAVKG